MEHLATSLTAAGGVVGIVLSSVFAYKRGSRKEKRKADDGHLQTFYETMNKHMSAQEERHRSAIEAVQLEQREERKQWAEERIKLSARIDKLQDESIANLKLAHDKDIEIAELKIQLRFLNERLDTTEVTATVEVAQ